MLGYALHAQSDQQATAASLSDQEGFELLGHIEGVPTGAMAVEQNLTAIAFQRQLILFDISGGMPACSGPAACFCRIR